VVRCGVDKTFAQHSSEVVYQKEASDCFVCVGRLCEQKGQLLLLDALAVLRARGIRPKLILAGDGEMRPEIESRIEKLQLQSQVSITGWLSGVEVKESLLRSRALVLPSFAEGLPVVIMESLSLERPVITTYVAGIPELVENGVNGWLVPAGSVEKLADAMSQALQASDEQLGRLGEAGRLRVGKLHDSDTEARRLQELCEEVARSRNRVVEKVPGEVQAEVNAA
jgi:glycosyltransferase involved in cell wall biosynthesis